MPVLADNCTLPPSQNVVAPPAVIVADGIAFTLICEITPLDPPGPVTVNATDFSPPEDHVTICGPAVVAEAGDAPLPKLQ